jgi:16S rRNA (uracil1498-N3)-methyltransferase
VPQYLVAAGAVGQGTFALDGEEARHAARVARARVGDELKLFDGEGRRWRGRIVSIGRERIEGAVLEEVPEPAARTDVRLYLALSAREAFEDALEKTTELGISEFHPIVTERSARWRAESSASKLRRWRDVSLSACKQCERPRAPALFEPVAFDRALRDGPGLLAHPGGEGAGPKAAGHEPLRVFVGPEGGFTDAEAGRAAAAGFGSLPLGPHILRTETAAAAACAVLLIP